MKYRSHADLHFMTYKALSKDQELCLTNYDLEAESYGMKADPLRYPWFKYDCFLSSGWRDIVTKRNFNQKLQRNMMENNERTNIRMDKWKDQSYILLGINARGIKI